MKMKTQLLKTTLWITFLLWVQLAAAGQFDRGILWKVTGNDLPSPSYIFGTLHLICPDDFRVFPGTERALDQSELVVLEIDLSDGELLKSLQAGLLMEDGIILENLLSEKDYARVTAFMSDSLKIPVQMYQSMQPFFIQSFLYPQMIGCYPTSYEDYFITQAAQKDIPVKGLETLDEQLNIFRSMTYEQQAEMLVKTINGYEEQKAEFRKLIDGYLAEDLSVIMEMFRKMEKETGLGYEEFNFRVMKERNHRWIPRMKGRMQRKSVFFAVGAGHLSGPDGILNLLSMEGYTITPVKE